MAHLPDEIKRRSYFRYFLLSMYWWSSLNDGARCTLCVERCFLRLYLQYLWTVSLVGRFMLPASISWNGRFASYACCIPSVPVRLGGNRVHQRVTGADGGRLGAFRRGIMLTFSSAAATRLLQVLLPSLSASRLWWHGT